MPVNSKTAGIAYRADIDGLRAVAVVSVAAYHAFPWWLKGGFIGVDVFFVISGFLISGIILGGLRRDSFSFLAFYCRRIRRIFPALLVVLAAAAIGGFLILLPGEYTQLSKHIAAGAGFVSNIALWQEAWNFGDDTEKKPLLNLWSLGVEEQFYIAWPLLLWSVYRRRHGAAVLCAAIFLASLLVNVYWARTDVAAAFYLPFARCWELLAGGLLACLALHTPRRLTGRYAHAASVIGMGCIGCAAMFAHLYGVGWQALAVGGAALSLASGPGAWANRHMLSCRPMVAMGRISYPFYLWHWPVQVLAQAAWPLNDAQRGGLLAVSLALAFLTYHGVEKYARFHRPTRATAALLAGLMACMGCVGYAGYRHHGYAERFPPIVAALSQAQPSVPKSWREHACFLEPRDSAAQFTPDCAGVAAKARIAVWGDAAAAALYPGIKDFADSHAMSVAQYTASSCAPLVDGTSRRCKDINAAALEHIRDLKPAMVLLSADWKEDKRLAGRLGKTVAALRRAGIGSIVLMGPFPQWPDALPRMLAAYGMRHDPRRWPPLSMHDALSGDMAARDARMQDIATRLGIDYFSAYQIMCTPQGCLTRTGDSADAVTAFDSVHLSPAGSAYMAQRMRGYFLRMLR